MSVLVSIVAVGLLIALHEAGHFAAARLTGMKVVRFSVGFFHPILSWRSRRTGITYQLGALPLGGFVQIKGMNPFEEGALEDPDSYQRQPVWKRAAVIASGPAANFLVAWALLFGLYASGVPEPVNEPVVGAVEEGGPAEEAGLMAGDRVVEIDGVPVATWIDLARAMHERPEREVDLLVERGGSRTGVKVTPERRGDIGLIGIHQPTEIVSLAPHVAALAALAKCAGLVTDTLAALGGWIAGTSDDVEPVGPVGIVRIAASTLDSGVAQFLALVAYFSVMLFLFNVLPLPALDGGRGVFLLWEGISRRRVNRKVDAVANTVGFFLIVGLLLIITVKEIFVG